MRRLLSATRPATGCPRDSRPIGCALAIGLILAATGACAPAPRSRAIAAATGDAEQRFVGWARVRGELMLFDTRAAAAAGPAPAAGTGSRGCISGVPPAGSRIDLARYGGRRVEIVGRVVDYASLPYEDRPLLARRVLAGSVVPNFCFGKQVIAVSAIRAIE